MATFICCVDNRHTSTSVVRTFHHTTAVSVVGDDDGAVAVSVVGDGVGGSGCSSAACFGAVLDAIYDYSGIGDSV